MNLPPTAVIISSRNRPNMLYETVESVLHGEQAPDEIIIIDQSHEPHPLLSQMQAVRGCKICYCWSQSVGSSTARNQAIRMAHQEYLAIIDDDILVTQDWLSRLIEGLMSGGLKAVVSGKVLDYGTSENGFAPSTKTDDEPAIYKGRVSCDVLWTGNMAMRRPVVEDVGFFDERLGPGTAFPAAEDNDYGFRLLEAGYQIHYVPSAIVYHRDWRPKKYYIGLRWKYGFGRGGYYAKHFHWRDRYTIHRMLKDIFNHLIAFPHKIRHERLQAYGDLVLIGGILVGAFCWLIRYGSKSLADRSSLTYYP